MDSIVGLSGFVKDLTRIEADDLLYAGAVACRNDAAFMAKLKSILDNPAPQAIGDGTLLKMLLAWLSQLLERLTHPGTVQAQAIDFATLLKIIAAIKTIIDLIKQLGGSLPGPTPSGYVPADANRCL